jgi:hypothetical protein
MEANSHDLATISGPSAEQRLIQEARKNLVVIPTNRLHIAVANTFLEIRAFILLKLLLQLNKLKTT